MKHLTVGIRLDLDRAIGTWETVECSPWWQKGIFDVVFPFVLGQADRDD